MSELLEKARKYENEERKKISNNDRPQFHFSSPVGWLNDPNGFSEYKGEHHLFFQYYPYATHWDSMHWGHTKSKDFIKWEYLPVALAPDCEYDNFGVFSGSAIEEEEKQILVYTAVKEETLENGKKCIWQNQCIAVGDGINYEKLKKNPVVTADMLPKGSSKEDFRDPKIWKEDNQYYMVVASRSSDGSGQIALFYAKGLSTWKFAGILDRSDNKLGKMWECPDFYPLGDKQILMISTQETKAEDLEFHNGNDSAFLIGNYNKEKLTFNRQKVQSIDHGLDFYAPQTMQTEDGRRIMIGWMQSWDNKMYSDNQSWSGMMTIPRELSLKNGRVCQQPVRELNAYRKNEVSYRNICIENCMEKEIKLKGIEGRIIDLELRIKGDSYEECRIKLASNENLYSEIIYNREKEILTFDRTYSGLKRDIISTRSMQAESKNEVLSLRILVDRYSVEIFVNNGEQVMTSLICTPYEANQISFASNGKTYIDVTKYDL